MTSMKLWIGNIAPGTSDDEIRAFVKKYVPDLECVSIERVDGDGSRPAAMLEFAGPVETIVTRLQRDVLEGAQVDRPGAEPLSSAMTQTPGDSMKDQTEALSRSATLAAKGGALLQKRLKLAEERFTGQVREIYETFQADMTAQPVTPWSLWQSGYDYALDAAQRTVLFWDTLRQRGNNFVEHERAGKPPLLHFDFETVLDGRTLERPVNYALVRIVPPAGIEVDAKRRPYVVIDPRAGHGPGIGGFKDDSQVGVALRDGHPVYFVIFYPEPEPGQTIARRVHRRTGVRAQGARAAPGEPQAGARRQLPGRLGGDDARRIQSGGHRGDRDQRRADVVLGRRLRGRRRRQPDALRRGAARRDVARRRSYRISTTASSTGRGS